MRKLPPFKRQFHIMVKHTQNIGRQIVDELFECVRPLCKIGAKRVKTNIQTSSFLPCYKNIKIWQSVTVKWRSFLRLSYICKKVIFVCLLFLNRRNIMHPLVEDALRATAQLQIKAINWLFSKNWFKCGTK